MLDRVRSQQGGEPTLAELEAAAYLSRCQVDTPAPIVRLVWDLVNRARPDAGAVVDFGCGDARFATGGLYASYTGFDSLSYIDNNSPNLVTLTFGVTGPDVLANNPAFSENGLFAFVNHLFLTQGLFVDHYSFNRPSWSISTEFYTYLLFGIVCLLKSRRQAFVAVIAAAAAG